MLSKWILIGVGVRFLIRYLIYGGSFSLVISVELVDRESFAAAKDFKPTVREDSLLVFNSQIVNFVSAFVNTKINKSLS